MHAFIARLYPICRSITGEGTRETLRLLQEQIPLVIHEVPTGTPVFDWTIPQEWNVRDAWVKDGAGRKLIDFRENNLHLVGYSSPVSGKMPFRELKEHLFTLPNHPSWIPYRTSYYKENWGFCLSEEQLSRFDPEAEYEVSIDSTLGNGSLSYGECFLPGQDGGEILISSHICHPSLANDNLSGIAVAVELARELANKQRRYSYRFLFVPGTIGAIAWLARNEDILPSIQHGLVLTCLGDSGDVTYKRSRRGKARMDRAAEVVLRDSGEPHTLLDFSPYGYDERQYCSPGIDLPVGCFMRSRHGQFPEYHTSADNLEFVRPEALADSLIKLRAILDVLEGDRTYLNRSPKGEPQLGKRGLYGSSPELNLATLWVLNLSDGRHSLLDIAERSKLTFEVVERAALALAKTDLLQEIS